MVGPAMRPPLLLKGTILDRKLVGHLAHTLAFYGHLLPRPKFRNRVSGSGRKTETIDDRFLISIDQNGASKSTADDILWRPRSPQNFSEISQNGCSNANGPDFSRTHANLGIMYLLHTGA